MEDETNTHYYVWKSLLILTHSTQIVKNSQADGRVDRFNKKYGLK